MQQIDISKIVPQKEDNKRKSTSFERLSSIMNKEIQFGSDKLSDKKKQQLYSDLFMLLSSGIDLRSAFEIIGDTYAKEKDKKMVETLINKVINGNTLSEAFRSSGLFSPYEYYSIQIGEETANLAKVLNELNRFFARKIEQRKKIVNAFTYPIIVVATAVLAVAFMLNFIVPMFEEIYSRFGQDLPVLTQYIIKFSHKMPLLLLIFAFMVLALFIFYRFAKKKTWFANYRDSLLIKLPIYGPIIKDIQLSRLFLSMELLLSSKTPLLSSIALAKEMTRFYPLSIALIEIEKSLIAGKTLSVAMANFSIFTKRIISLIRVGEEVNQLEKTFTILKDLYQDQVEQRSNTISSILEPLMVVFIGIFVALILIAMYLPIFKMSTNFAL